MAEASLNARFTVIYTLIDFTAILLFVMSHLLAKPNATPEELRNACEKACILEDIESAENG